MELRAQFSPLVCSAGQLVIPVLALVASLFAPASVAEMNEPEEAGVRELVLATERAIESGDVGSLWTLTSERYHDDEHRTRRQLIEQVTNRVERAMPLHLLVVEAGLELRDPDGVSVDLLVAATSTPLVSVIDLDPLIADLGRVRLQLVREHGSWRILSASWTEARPADFLGH